MMKIADINKKFKTEFKNNEELITREFKGLQKPMSAIFLTSICDVEKVATELIKPISEMKSNKKTENSIAFLQKNVITAANATIIENFDAAITEISKGSVVLAVEGESKFLAMPFKTVAKRAIAEPPTSNVVYGPRQGFIEDKTTNLTLIRARLPGNDLKITNITVGSKTLTEVSVVSLSGVADKQIETEIINSIKKIKIDGVLDSYYIQSFLQKRPDSIFKQVGITEKPDILAAKLLEGRIAVIVDGSPIVLTLPFILIEDLQASDDYYEEKTKVSFMRLVRVFGVLLAVILPGLYISFGLFHYKALPIKFLITILNGSQGIPFSPAVEVLFTFFLFEILYEASIRIPKGLGSSFNIVGALILGDTAVKSNLASPTTVMIVALSSIALYLIPEQTSVLRLVRILFIITATLMGAVGICIAMVFIIAYLCDFDSYGAAYLAPYAPFIKQDLKDGFIKKGIQEMKTTPKSINKETKKRAGRGFDAED